MTTSRRDTWHACTLAGTGLGVAHLVGVTVVALILALRISITAGLVAAGGLALGVMIRSVWGGLLWGILTGLGAGITAGLSAWAITEYVRLSAGPSVHDVPVSEAPRYPRAVRFAFRDGQVAASLHGAVSHRQARGQSTTTLAAPMVDAEWVPGQAVTAWVCARDVTPPAEWARPIQQGVRVQGHLLDDCRDAARRAERAHGLASSPGAPVLEWIDHRQALAERRTAAIGGPLVGLGLYLLLMGIGAFSEWASRRAGRG